MTETFIQLHHMGWPLAVIAIAIAAAVVMVRKAARRDTTHGADGH